MVTFLSIVLCAIIPLVVLIRYIKKVEDLSRDVKRLDQKVRQLADITVAQPESVNPSSEGQVAERIRVFLAGQTPPHTSAEPRQSPPVVQTKYSVPRPPSRTRGEWEALIGGKLLNRVGAFALIIGIGLFLQHAFSNNWITEPVRAIIGFLTGAGLLWFGARTYKKGLQVFSQGVFGAGIAVLYLSCYASFNLYHILSQGTAFTVMSLVTIATMYIALRYESLATSLLGWFGGALTPFLLSTGVADTVGLFSYLLIFEAGLIVIAMKKPRWNVLELLTIGGIYVTYLTWYRVDYKIIEFWPGFIFLCLFWAMQFCAELFRPVPMDPQEGWIRKITSAVNIVFFYPLLYALVDSMHHPILGLATLLVGAVYLLPFVFRRGRIIAAARGTMFYVVVAMFMIVIAADIEYSKYFLVMVWSVDLTILVVCGIRWRLRYVVDGAVILLALILLQLTAAVGSPAYLDYDRFILVVNTRSLSMALLAGALVLSGWMLKKNSLEGRDHARRIFQIVWPFIILWAMALEINGYFNRSVVQATPQHIAHVNFMKMMVCAMVWSAYALVLIGGASWKKSLTVLEAGVAILVFPLTTAFIFGIAYQPITEFVPVLNIRFFAMLVTIGISIFIISILRKEAGMTGWIRAAVSILNIIVVLLLLALCTGEVRDIFEKPLGRLVGWQYSSERGQIENMKQLSLSGLWLLYATGALAFGIWKRNQPMRMLAIVLLGLSILKIFIYDLSFLERIYRIGSFIALGVILLVASYLYQRYKHLIFGSTEEAHSGGA